MSDWIEVNVLQEERPRARASLGQVALAAGVMAFGAVAADRLPVGGQSELGSGGAVAAVPHQYDGGAALGRVERHDEGRMPAGDGDDGHAEVGEHARRAVVEMAERVDVGRVKDRRVIAPLSLVDVCPVKRATVRAESQPDRAVTCAADVSLELHVTVRCRVSQQHWTRVKLTPIHRTWTNRRKSQTTFSVMSVTPASRLYDHPFDFCCKMMVNLNENVVNYANLLTAVYMVFGGVQGGPKTKSF